MSFLKSIKGFFLRGIILSILIIEPVQANWFTDLFRKVGDFVTTSVHKVDQTVTTVVHKIAPPPIRDLYDKVHNALDPVKIEKDLLARINYEAEKISNAVVDQEVINQINAVLADFRTVNNAAQDILRGPCGPHAFVQRIPPWFKQQVGNLHIFVDLAKDGVAIMKKIMESAPDVLALALTLEKIGAKVVKSTATPQNIKTLFDVANNFRKSISTLQQIPAVISDAVSFVTDVGTLITEGSVCAGSLATDITEGVEAVAEGVGGVAACAASAGAGCVEELLTLKSAAVGAVSTLVSDASCALTVVKIAKDGAKDLYDLVKFLTSLKSIVAEVNAIKKAVGTAVQALTAMEKAIQEDMPTLKKQTDKIGVDFGDVAKMVTGIIPKVELFGKGLLGQFKHNIDEMMVCKAKVDHLIAIAGKNFAEGVNHLKEAAQHVLKMGELRKLVLQEIEVARHNALNQMHGHITDMQKRVEEIKQNPLNAFRDLPIIVADAAHLPIDLAKAAIQTLDQNTRPHVNEVNQNKAAVQSSLQKAKQLLSQTQTTEPKQPQLLQVKEDAHLNASALTQAITSLQQDVAKPIPPLTLSPAPVVVAHPVIKVAPQPPTSPLKGFSHPLNVPMPAPHPTTKGH